MELCGECKTGALLCSSCGVQVQPPADPTQLEIFPQMPRVKPARVDTPSPEERYWVMRHQGSGGPQKNYRR